MKKIIFICFIAFLQSRCLSQNNNYKVILNNPDLFSATVHELNEIVMGNNFSPIVASRNYLYASVAAYEVIAAGYPDKYRSLAGQINGLQSVPKPKPGEKINFEFSSLLAFCTLGESATFPQGSMKAYVDSIKTMAKVHGMPSEEFNNSVAFADKLSKAILIWSKKDNYAQTRGMARYAVMMEDPGRWVPTAPAYDNALEPHWSKIRPLVMDSASQFAPPPPIKFNVRDSNSAYYKEVVEMIETSKNLTPEQKHIADFWDDNPFKLNVNGHVKFATKKFSPPGHWMGIVGIAAQKMKADFPTTVYAYAKTTIAMFDAFIQCWDEKYRHNTVRPVTPINDYFMSNWEPYLQTPPFPEYTCGHSTCSSAAAEALTSIFGDNVAYTDTTELEFGIKNRSFKSFRDAANENIIARFYGGIHYHSTCMISAEYGKKVGAYVVKKLHMKK